MKQDLACPYLYEEKNTIEFELLCDHLSSTIGQAASFSKTYTFLEEELINIASLTYQLSTSVRNKNTIKEKDTLFLQSRYAIYQEATNYSGQIIVPQGHIIATTLHVARCLAKETVRKMHVLRMEGHLIEENLFDFANALADYLMMAALFANKVTDTEEQVFTT